MKDPLLLTNHNHKTNQHGGTDHPKALAACLFLGSIGHLSALLAEVSMFCSETLQTPQDGVRSKFLGDSLHPLKPACLGGDQNCF